MKTTVEHYMTRSPHTIGRAQTIKTAHFCMSDNGIRHLPVLEGGHLIGIVSERDLQYLETFRDIDVNAVTVDEAMTPGPYTVTGDTPLLDVVKTMASHKYGAAIVVDKAKVVGIFSTIDALRAMSELLESALGPEPKPASPCGVHLNSRHTNESTQSRT